MSVEQEFITANISLFFSKACSLRRKASLSAWYKCVIKPEQSRWCNMPSWIWRAVMNRPFASTVSQWNSASCFLFTLRHQQKKRVEPCEKGEWDEVLELFEMYLLLFTAMSKILPNTPKNTKCRSLTLFQWRSACSCSWTDRHYLSVKEKEEAEEQTRKDIKNNRDGFHMTGVKIGTVGQHEQCSQDAWKV